MKGSVTAVALVAAVIGVSTSATPATPDVPTVTPSAVDPTAGPQAGDTTAGLDEDGLPPRIEYPDTLEFTCDETGVLVRVRPDDPQARAAAERGCLRLHIATDRAPWPGGVRP